MVWEWHNHPSQWIPTNRRQRSLTSHLEWSWGVNDAEYGPEFLDYHGLVDVVSDTVWSTRAEADDYADHRDSRIQSGTEHPAGTGGYTPGERFVLAPGM